jgi:hypothetical protein
MKFKHYILLVALTIGFVTLGFSQHRAYDITNGFGIMGGITQFDIQTDNFMTNQGNGFVGGMTATVDIPHRWYNMSFGMQLSENHIEISARPSTASSLIENVEYKMFAAQVALLMHIKPFQDFLIIDVGPMLQYNGKLELEDKAQENYIINDYVNLSASNITNISQFNFNGAIGASVGIKQFKVKAQYIYGFTNILKKLSDQDIDTSGSDSDFKGNQTMLILAALFTF